MRQILSLLWTPTLCLAIGIAAGLGCEIGPSSTGIHRLVPYDSTYSFAVGEDYATLDGPMTPRISFHQKTDQEFPNYNYRIVNTTFALPGLIRFTYHGILIPEEVQPLFGPARTVNYFKMNDGVYSIVFFRGNQHDLYEVTIDDTMIAVSPEGGSFTHSEHAFYWRYRPQSFALFCGTWVGTSYLCDDIVDSLYAHIDLEEFFYPDSGVVGYGRSSDGHQYDAPARYFYYNSEADFHQAGEILEQFTLSRQEEFHGVGIQIINWLQDSYLSWEFSTL